LTYVKNFAAMSDATDYAERCCIFGTKSLVLDGMVAFNSNQSFDGERRESACGGGRALSAAPVLCRYYSCSSCQPVIIVMIRDDNFGPIVAR